MTLSCPADLPAEVREEVRRLAVASFEAFGCEGIARVDCFYTESGDVVVNEINTMPATPHSMYPRCGLRLRRQLPAADRRSDPTGARPQGGAALDAPLGLRAEIYRQVRPFAGGAPPPRSAATSGAEP